ncbi:membrane metallo-endopeptidase-like 1 isoform X2 [Acanthaster planci]|uniref:Membrane metallo-endopeptidase-like 1 isoform X2 n=1 Tax=Acanthaster planci TaxID=133434 RepID=A0A8B7YUM2_ACAPL|nr:membrane metallo-endopeptidase-like 1 isoform X2 [Acanthaster planci]
MGDYKMMTRNSGSSVNPFVNNNMEGSRQKLTFEEQVIYKRPTKVYMITLLILALTTIAVLVPLVVVVLERNKLAKDVEEMKSSQNSRLCTSEQCVKSAGIYLDNMNQRADPCDNFFEYACGGWVKKKVIPEDRSSFSAFTDLREEVAVKCKELFERDGKPGEAKSITSVRNFYKSCLDLDKINEKNSQPLMDLLQALGGWPVLGNTQGGNWNRSSFQFESFWAFLSGKYGADLIVSSWVGVDDKNSSSHILKLDQPSLGLGSRDYYRDAEFEEERAAYLQYMVDVIVELGGDEATARPEMANVLEFETTIANMSTPKAERRDNEALYNIYTLEELTTVYPQINWTLYYDLVMPEKVKPILPSERIVNRAPAYMENLTDWLEAQDNRVIANYMVWRLVDIMVPDLGQTFIDIYQRYLNVLRGTSTTSARWKRCVNEGNIVSEFAIGRMYVEENFPAVAKEKTVEMIGNLKTAFKAMLETNDWLQEADKKVAAEKADKMRIDVGYPDWIMDDVKLDEKYQGLDFLADTYFENSLLFRQWSRTDSLSLLRDIVDRTAWTSGPAVVNAYFSSSKNRILFPAGILQPPFYHQDLPWYSNYGGIGVVIGHEITHGFDDRGRQYDKDGNLVDWWSADSVVKFKERAQCIVDQYGDFVMPETGETLNGVQTQGENIADNGGLKESYKAYKDNVANEPALPGLNFTADQMFFLTFGQIWCSAFRPEGVTSQILSGVHSPGRYRVIGPMQNNEAFAKAFSCPPTSYMNPADKCNVW